VATGRISAHFSTSSFMSLLPASFTDSLDNVVFEGRNQAYGAYQLRQDYQQHLASAGGFTMGLCAMLLLSWGAWQHLKPVEVARISTPRIIEFIEPPITPVIEKPKVAVLTPPRARPVATHQAPSQSKEVVKDNLPQPHITPPAPTAIIDGPTGPATSSTVSSTDTGEIAGPTGGTEVGPATAPATTQPFIVVEKMPEFEGGQAALLRYLQKHLRYPGSALAAGIGGKVFMSFVVGADGTISDVTILKGLGYGLDEEAQRVVRQMPAWTPGYQSKHPVPVRFTLPITFSIQ
jgi:protein TonB